MPAPAQSRPRTFFPTAINMYRQCPERYYRHYILKKRRPQPFSRPLLTGGATHRLIARVLPTFMRTGQKPKDLLPDALREVSTSEYPPEEVDQRERDAADVVEWTFRALDMLPERSSLRLQERQLSCAAGKSGVEIGAQVDVVLQRSCGTVEHIDFKTGKVRDNTVQNLIARAVVGRHFGNAPGILTSTLYLRHGQYQSAELTADGSRLEWQGIARDIREIRSLGRFPPNPGPLCEFCPYQSRDCSVW
ncbi:MAG: PD-(D/E)XK nuclease family protein [Thermomicrobiales bacterium]